MPPTHALPTRPLCQKLLLGMTGSVSVLLMPYNIFVLRQIFARQVQVIISRTVSHFITPYALQLCSGQEVFADSFQTGAGVLAPHVQLTHDIDLFLIMPATANTLAKAAHGLCDDLLSTAIVSCQAPLVFVPSMNERMWLSRTVQRNVQAVRDLGYHVIEPGRGVEIANMQQMVGTMPTIEAVLLKLVDIMQPANGSSPPPQ